MSTIYSAEVANRTGSGDGEAPFIHPADIIDGDSADVADEIDTAEIGHVPLDALSAFLRFIIPAKDPHGLAITDGRTRWDTAALRVAALAHAILPEVREIPERKLAAELRVSRSGFCKMVTALRDFAKLDCRAGKSSTARAAYSLRAKECWARKKAQQVAP